MKIIGHRGAAGLAPENTIAAIRAGIDAGADAIEFDIRLTSDGEFVLVHDISLLRIVGTNTIVSDLPVSDLRIMKTISGEKIPTLVEALKAAEEVTAVIEPKGNDWAGPLTEALRKYKTKPQVCVIAFNREELVRFHTLMPEVPTYALERQNAFSTIRHAHNEGLHGINLNFWILNPFSYLYARLLGLEVLAHTVDRPFYMRYIKTFYPRVGITTNYPQILKKILRVR